MADKENCVHITRLAKKRITEATAPSESQQPATKKLVVLGELPNSSNVLAARDLESEPQKPKCGTKKKVKKAVTTTEVTTTTTPTQDVDAKSEDPQLCVAYVSEIY